MTCQHDPLYRINNEKAGGAGCPLCAAERRKTAQDKPLLEIQRLAALVLDGPRPGWISKTDRMLTPTDEIDADWIARVWPTLQETRY